ncbi:MAG: hypothetical protein AAFQ80_07960 [Cyanobacteria bacterium J06621_8]
MSISDWDWENEEGHREARELYLLKGGSSSDPVYRFGSEVSLREAKINSGRSNRGRVRPKTEAQSNAQPSSNISFTTQVSEEFQNLDPNLGVRMKQLAKILRRI